MQINKGRVFQCAHRLYCLTILYPPPMVFYNKHYKLSSAFVLPAILADTDRMLPQTTMETTASTQIRDNNNNE